ncbi:MAG TPA: M10 family metallopeptidase C-terminal domain-containing protein [Pirellulaceae bacterium]|nr:M10 family metallopeptidase C-terminal domain-containing protein [Pirellulaceae bacterium]HMO90962.1 M10 family metallopeptidase C-terminal domain-containing protein [Pirellulaceae bacterium]HMP69860.1 M10 family metallopeptidase C-terminal domain-containing protein [Pirellulaceae bacterium]
MNTPPVVNVQDLTVLLGGTINGLNLVTTSDAENDPITRWQFVDSYGGDESGFFRVNGVRRDANTIITMTNQDLASLEYVAGSQIGRETIRARVFDGQAWSTWIEFFIYTARPNVNRPVVTSFPFQVVAYEKIFNVSAWINASDPDGHPIDRYLFRDRGIGDGYFELNGVKLNENQWNLVLAKDLPKLRYVGSLAGGTEIIDVMARDGLNWSLNHSFVATTRPNLERPLVEERTFRLPSSVFRSLKEFVNVSDADGNSIKRYRVFDTSIAPGSAYLEVEGVVQPDKTWIELTPEQFRNSVIWTATTARSDQFRIQAFDGKFWSPIATVTVLSDRKPQIVAQTVDGLGIVVADSHFDEFRLADYFDYIPSVPSFVRYQVIDRRANFGPQLQPGGQLSGDMRLNPTPQNPGSISDNFIRTLTPSEFSQVRLRGGFQTGRDDILVRGFNGQYWSDWTRLIFQTNTGWLTAGTSWNNFTPPVGNIVTFSFAGFFRQDDRDTGGVQQAEFLPISFEGRMAFRRQFQRLNELVANTFFVEVPDSYVDPLTGTEHGLIRIHGWVPNNFDQPLPLAFSFPPTDHSDPISNQEGGDIWITHVSPFAPAVTLAGGGNWGIDTVNGTMVAREILSAVGVGGPATNDSAFGLSRGPDPRGQAPPGYNGGVARSFGLWDIYNLQQLYGANPNFNNGNTVYDFAYFGSFNFVDHIYDTGGIDTLDLSASNGNGTVTIVEGEVSSVQTFAGTARIGITYGTVIENIITGNGNMNVRGNEASNIIRTGSGNDTIRGFGGNDFLYGGAGDDTYVFGLADGYNVIDEEQMAGRDRILIERSETMRLNDLAEDVLFRRLGRDLMIDFTINGEYTSSRITIKDQAWGRSRIETLNIFGIDVDLTRIWALTTAGGSRFNIDFDSAPTIFGRLVTPA